MLVGPTEPIGAGFFRASIHPSGTDIIRTWAYYLMVRHLAMFNETPFKSVLINGMVLGQDGRKMSKSLKNYMAAPEALNKYGADAIRQWAAGGRATGSDIPYRVQDVEYGRRFLVKLWNASGFAIKLLADYQPDSEAPMDLQLLDRWMISQTENVIKRVTEAYEKCQFNIAMEEIGNFSLAHASATPTWKPSKTDSTDLSLRASAKSRRSTRTLQCIYTVYCSYYHL